MKKHIKRGRKRHSVIDKEQNVDRLSALPDSVICHILSFMPTKLSVKTSILAKRWRLMWTHVPCLDLQAGKGSSQTTSIICMLILRHKVESLNTFRLTYTGYGVHTVRNEFETCIATAIERNVQNLDLFIDVELPGCALTCKTLVDLRLDGGISIPSSGPIYLPNLKKLYFHPHPHDYDVYFPRLVSGCPVLEELVIDPAPFLNLGGFTLSSPTLKSLTISFSIMLEFRLMINTPALRYLKLHGYMVNCTSVSLLNSLIEADISLRNGDSCVLKLLDSICNVKCLKLSCFNLQKPASIVKFGSLTKLQLSANRRFVTKFLESADHLQELIISEGLGYLHDWVDPIEEECACLLNSLRTVRIDGFSCREEGFNMVRYILRKAHVLERMEIYCRRDLQENFDALQRIPSFRRGSKECKLAFS